MVIPMDRHQLVTDTMDLLPTFQMVPSTIPLPLHKREVTTVLTAVQATFHRQRSQGTSLVDTSRPAVMAHPVCSCILVRHNTTKGHPNHHHHPINTCHTNPCHKHTLLISIRHHPTSNRQRTVLSLLLLTALILVTRALLLKPSCPCKAHPSARTDLLPPIPQCLPLAILTLDNPLYQCRCHLYLLCLLRVPFLPTHQTCTLLPTECLLSMAPPLSLLMA